MAASHTYGSIYRDVRDGTLRPVYYLTGDEDVLKDELTAHIVEHSVDPSARDFNLDVRAAGDLDGEALSNLIETPPMLAERRTVVIKHLEQWRRNAKVWKVLERYVTQPADTTVLVLVHGAGQQPHRPILPHICHVTVDPLPANRVARWIENRATAAGFALEPDAIRFLLSAAGTDLSLLVPEIEKLGAAARGEPLTADRIAELVGVRQGETVDDWVAAVLERDVGRAAGMLDAVLAGSGVTPVRLVTQLGTALIGTRTACALMDEGTPQRQLSSAIFQLFRRMRPAGLGDWKTVAGQWADAALRWTDEELDRAIRATLQADRSLKSPTVSDNRGILLEMLLRTGGTRAAA